MRFLLGLFLLAPAFAVDGTVINKTTGRPAAGVVVSLYKLGAGMEIVASARTDAQGRFTIARDAGGPRLLQTIFDGVVYNQMLQQDAPASGVAVEVFQSSKKPVPVGTHFLYLQPSGGKMTVNDVFIFRNEGNVTFNDSAGTLKFYAPEKAEGLNVRATAPGGMPVERPAQKTRQAGVHSVDFPVKPGETRFEITYGLPYSDGMEFEVRNMNAGETMLLAPPGVNISGEGLENKGQEPSTQATIFAASKAVIKAAITGEVQAAAGSASSGPEMEQIPPKLFERAPVILIIAFAALALGALLLYRKPQESHATRGRR
ncbi:MAG: hypothetical protein ACE15B_00470 [Bryobacteraceae bacterium]